LQTCSEPHGLLRQSSISMQRPAPSLWKPALHSQWAPPVPTHDAFAGHAISAHRPLVVAPPSVSSGERAASPSGISFAVVAPPSLSSGERAASPGGMSLGDDATTTLVLVGAPVSPAGDASGARSMPEEELDEPASALSGGTLDVSSASVFSAGMASSATGDEESSSARDESQSCAQADSNRLRPNARVAERRSVTWNLVAAR